MGTGERAKDTRDRLAGKVCAKCYGNLSPPDKPGERLCLPCTPRYLVLMNFFRRKGWQVSFVDRDRVTALPLELTFGDAEKIREMHRRYGSQIAADIQAMEYGIQTGRGGIWLMIDLEHYLILQRGKRNAPPGRARPQGHV